MDILVMGLLCVISCCVRVKRLSIANVLVTVHTMFSISLLGVGSPYMGHHFQVQVLCHLQGRSLEGLRLLDHLLLFCCITCISSQGLSLCRVCTLFLQPSVVLGSCKPIGRLLLLSICNTFCKNTLMIVI